MSGSRQRAAQALRVVHVAAAPYPSPQGSQVYIRGMVRSLAQRGHAVTLLCYGHGSGAGDPEVRLLRAPAPPGYGRLRSGPDPVKPLLDLAMVAMLARQAGELVHAHNYEGALVALAARRLRPRPVVYSAHTTMAEELHSYFRSRPVRASARCLGRALDQGVPRRCDQALALSQQSLGLLRDLGCARPRLLPPGVDPHDLRPAVPATLPPGPWVVYAGNPDRYQDLDVLMAAMELLPEAGLLLVSASPLDHLRRAGPGRLLRVRTSDFEEVRRLLAAADVAALPRAVCTGYPVKLLNYLGMGLPTVAARGSARPLPGVLPVPPGDPPALAQALQALISDGPRRRQLGAEARAHVLRSCSWQARAVELEDIYTQVLDRVAR